MHDTSCLPQNLPPLFSLLSGQYMEQNVNFTQMVKAPPVSYTLTQATIIFQQKLIAKAFGLTSCYYPSLSTILAEHTSQSFAMVALLFSKDFSGVLTSFLRTPIRHPYFSDLSLISLLPQSTLSTEAFFDVLNKAAQSHPRPLRLTVSSAQMLFLRILTPATLLTFQVFLNGHF